jgi:hypothetical protein
MFADSNLGELPQLSNIAFSGTEFWQMAENVARLATMENKLKFLPWCSTEIYV